MTLGKCWCGGFSAALVAAVAIVPAATAAGPYKSCGQIHGYGGVVAKNVEVQEMTCGEARSALTSSKSTEELGYKCATHDVGTKVEYGCTRDAGGKVRFYETH